MKRLTKSQYEMIGQVLKSYIDDRSQYLDDPDKEWRDEAKLITEVINEITESLAHKFMWVDDQFDLKEFYKICGHPVYEKRK